MDTEHVGSVCGVGVLRGVWKTLFVRAGLLCGGAPQLGEEWSGSGSARGPGSRLWTGGWGR